MFKFYKIKRFSLIELIIVIAILGILAAIVIPNIRDIQGKSRITAIVSDVRNLQTSVDMYQLENYGEYPVVGEEQPSIGLPKQLSFDKLYPKYIRNLPKNEGLYYWVDYSGKVWFSTIDSPKNIEKSDTEISWENIDNAVSYSVYEVENNNLTGSIGNIKEKHLATIIGTENYTPEDYNKDKTYLVSAIDVNGFETAPVGMGYKGISMFMENQQEPIIPVTPTPPFIKNYGGSGSDTFQSIERTNDGGYVAVGSSKSSDGDLTENKGSSDFVIAKFDGNGNKVWIKNYGGSGLDYFYSVQETSDGGYVAVGYSYSPDGDLTGNKGSNDFVIAKFDSDGNKVWIKNYGGSDGDYFNSVQETSDGGYVAVGFSQSSDGDLTENKGCYDFVIAKFDSDGNKVWIKNYGGSNYDYFHSVQETSDGGYVAVGFSQSSDGDLTRNKGENDFVIAKFDSNGNKVWIKNYGGSSTDYFYSVQETSDGGYVAVGYSLSSDRDLTENKGSSDFVIAKFDGNGNKMWIKNYGGSNYDYFNSVQETSDGGYVAVGYSNSPNGDLSGNKGGNDFIIAKFSEEGELYED